MIGLAAAALAALTIDVDGATVRCAEAETQLQLNLCAAEDYRRADADLNARWEQLDEVTRERLRVGQRAWVRFRDAECEGRGAAYRGGSILPMIVSQCRADLTRARMVDLVEAGRSPQAPATAPITIGTRYNLHALDAPREVNVVLPPSYADSEAGRYPVVYLIDGGMGQDLMLGAGLARWTQMWGRTAEFILVGIETIDRQRELLPATDDPAERERYPTAGESAAFRAWIRETVKPLVAADFRTDGRDALIGESAAGHFVVESWLAEPDLFGRFAAISPSLQWSNEALSRRAADALKAGSRMPPLYLALADEGGATEDGFDRLVAAIPPSTETCLAARNDVTHATIYHAVAPGALQFLMPGEESLPPEWGMTPGCAER